MHITITRASELGMSSHRGTQKESENAQFVKNVAHKGDNYQNAHLTAVFSAI